MKLERQVQHKTLFNGEKRLWVAYSEDEVPPEIHYEYWKTHNYDRVTTEGKVIWILSDDGMVVPIYSVAHVKGTIVLRGPFGTFLLPRNKRKEAVMHVLFSNRAQVEDYAGYKKKPGALQKALVCKLAAHGMDVGEIIDVLCVSKDSERAKRLKRYYRSEECSIMVREEVRNILNNCGLTEEKVVTMLLDAHEVAKGKSDAANMLRATENLVDMYGLKDKAKESTTNTLELDSEVEDLERLESVKERLKLTQKLEAQ